MQVTNVRIRLINTEGRLKAVGSITLNDSFVVHDVRVLEGERGMFVAMPSKQMPNGMFRDVAHPINTETRTLIDNKVLEAFEEALKEAEVETVEKREEEWFLFFFFNNWLNDCFMTQKITNFIKGEIIDEKKATKSF